MDCPHIPELSYSEFGERLRRKIAGRRIPITGSLELTFRCNLRCVHCYVAHGHLGVPGQAELALPQIQGILDQIVDEGCLWLLLTGGEPLVRPDFIDIYTYAKRKGLILTLFTNGTLLTPQIADYLAEWRPFRIEITLYGRTQETYEWVTGIPGSHARCLRGIDLLLERGLPLRLKTMLMTVNRHELWDMKAYAEELGLDFRFDPMVNAGLDGSSHPLELRLTPNEIVDYDLADPQRMENWQQFLESHLAPPSDPERLYNCGAGLRTFHIDPQGRLSACLMARRLSYDLMEGSFRNGWHDFLPTVREQARSRPSPCAHCSLISLCGQCPGWAQIEYGDQERPIDFLCQIAHLRARALGLGQPSLPVSQPVVQQLDSSEPR
jgi:radical SAM protein with 4Fe4S-binding SPASM domain